MRARARARQLGSSGSVNAIVRVRALRVHNWLTYSVAGGRQNGGIVLDRLTYSQIKQLIFKSQMMIRCISAWR